MYSHLGFLIRVVLNTPTLFHIYTHPIAPVYTLVAALMQCQCHIRKAIWTPSFSIGQSAKCTPDLSAHDIPRTCRCGSHVHHLIWRQLSASTIFFLTAPRPPLTPNPHSPRLATSLSVSLILLQWKGTSLLSLLVCKSQVSTTRIEDNCQSQFPQRVGPLKWARCC